MKLLQFAVASVVDANTGYGLSHNAGSIDYAAEAQHGRAIRSKSIVAIYGLIKDQLGSAISNYRARVAKQRQIATLARLNDNMLKDIGLSRGDVFALKMGQVTLEQLDAQRRKGHQKALLDLHSTTRVGRQTLELDAVNEAVYTEQKSA